MTARKSLTYVLLGVLLSVTATAQTSSTMPTIPAVNGGSLATPVDVPQYRDTVFPINPGLIMPPSGLIQVYDPGKTKAGPLTVGGSSIFSLRALCRSFAGSKLKGDLAKATNAAEIRNTAYLALKNIFLVLRLLDDRWMLNATEKSLLSDLRYEVRQWHPLFAETAEQFCEAEDLGHFPRMNQAQANYTREAVKFINQVLRTTEVDQH
ncbi:MAG: hypothetical protein HUU57_16755 [Bdellovibrio sp.]|nr:hypothetical protein [Bdellovibrio sp.]